MFAYLRCFAVIAILLSAAKAQAETIILVGDAWCPYNCEPGSEKPGFIIEIAQKIFAEHSINVEYRLLPWTRAIEETREGKHTAIIGAAHGDAPDFIFPKISVGKAVTAFFVKKENSWRFSGIESLHNMSLGVISGYSYNDDLDTYIDENRQNLSLVQEVSGDNALEANFNKLQLNRVSVVAENTAVAAYTLSTMGLTDKIISAGDSPADDQDDIFLAFSPAHPRSQNYAAIMDAGLKKLEDSGEMQKILLHYGLY